MSNSIAYFLLWNCNGIIVLNHFDNFRKLLNVISFPIACIGDSSGAMFEKCCRKRLMHSKLFPYSGYSMPERMKRFPWFNNAIFLTISGKPFAEVMFNFPFATVRSGKSLSFFLSFFLESTYFTKPSSRS